MIFFIKHLIEDNGINIYYFYSYVYCMCDEKTTYWSVIKQSNKQDINKSYK